MENKHGEFDLLDFCLPGFPERIPRTLPTVEGKTIYI